MEFKWWLWVEIKKNKIKKNRFLFFKFFIFIRKISLSEFCEYFWLNFVKEMMIFLIFGIFFNDDFVDD